MQKVRFRLDREYFSQVLFPYEIDAPPTFQEGITSRHEYLRSAMKIDPRFAFDVGLFTVMTLLAVVLDLAFAP